VEAVPPVPLILVSAILSKVSVDCQVVWRLGVVYEEGGYKESAKVNESLQTKSLADSFSLSVSFSSLSVFL
jgi:hypothetical protein